MLEHILFRLRQKIKKILFVFVFTTFCILGYTSTEYIFKLKHPVVIAFSVDNNYALFIPITIKSIEKHSNPNRISKIVILGNKISHKNTQAILAL